MLNWTRCEELIIHIARQPASDLIEEQSAHAQIPNGSHHFDGIQMVYELLLLNSSVYNDLVEALVFDLLQQIVYALLQLIVRKGT